MRDQHRLTLEFLDNLYAGALDEQAWSLAMAQLASLMSAVGPYCISIDPSTGTILREEGYGYDPRAMTEYRDEWAARDPRVIACAGWPIDQPIIDQEIQPLRDFKRTEFYNEFLLRNDIPWGIGTWLHQSPRRQTYIALHGRPDRRPFDPRDRALMQRFAPHLRRALEIKDRLALAGLHTEALRRTFDRATFGLMILDEEAHVLDASELAVGVLERTGAIRRTPGSTTTFVDPVGATLRQLVATCMQNGQLKDGALRIPRQGGLPLTLVLAPVKGSAQTWFSDRPSWVLFVFDPEARLTTLVQQLSMDLGITVREAEVCALVVEGLDLHVISARLGVSPHTIRTQLKSIFRKTGVCSQAELVRACRPYSLSQMSSSPP
jgi:DNA-binding CsgD family transcriptional regulator